MPSLATLSSPLLCLFKRSIITLCSLILIACQAALPKESAPAQHELLHNDSTVYFNDRKASVSMRASFSNNTGQHKNASFTQTLSTGYKLQFRSISRENVLINNVFIIAGGKRIIVSESDFFVAPNKGITLALSHEDSLFIQQKNDAVLRFAIDGKSQLMNMRHHKLSEFTLP